MRIVALYHPNSEQQGIIEDYARDYHIRHPAQKIEQISLDTVQGAEMAALYGVVRYPALLAIGPDGILLKLWQDLPLPLMDELTAYAT